MKFKFDKKLAVDYGVNAAFLLGYLWQKNCELAEAKFAKQHSRRWIRSGHSSTQPAYRRGHSAPGENDRLPL